MPVDGTHVWLWRGLTAEAPALPRTWYGVPPSSVTQPGTPRDTVVRAVPPALGRSRFSSLFDHDSSTLRQRLAHLLPAGKTKRELLSPVWAANTSRGLTSACAQLYPGTPAHPRQRLLPLGEGLALAHLREATAARGSMPRPCAVSQVCWPCQEGGWLGRSWAG